MDSSTNGQLSDEEELPGGWRRTVALSLGVLAFLAMAVFWIWAFQNTDSIAHPDEFDDPVFATAAEELCSQRQAAIAALPLATAVENPQERAELVELGTLELAAMVRELGELTPPTDPKGADGVEQWLDDYELYLDDRRRWSATLRTGESPPFTISGNAQGVRVTDLLTTFAEVNMMDSCGPSGDA